MHKNTASAYVPCANSYCYYQIASLRGRCPVDRRPVAFLPHAFIRLTQRGCAINTMFLQRTPKALEELAPGQRHLNQRQRSVLLLAERLHLQELQALFEGQGSQLVQELLAQGYLQSPSTVQAPRSATTSAASPTPVSLAGARMHLFDLCERMFANRMPSTAEQLRQMLRQARDLPSMLTVRDAFLEAMALHAGSERAEVMRRQLQAMLPNDTTTATEDCVA